MGFLSKEIRAFDNNFQQPKIIISVLFFILEKKITFDNQNKWVII